MADEAEIWSGCPSNARVGEGGNTSSLPRQAVSRSSFSRRNFFRRKGEVSYVLTNKRAIIMTGKDENQKILQQCDLNGIRAVIQNLTTVSCGEYVGDVLFLKDGLKVLTFTNVKDAENVKETTNQVIGYLEQRTKVESK